MGDAASLPSLRSEDRRAHRRDLGMRVTGDDERHRPRASLRRGRGEDAREAGQGDGRRGRAFGAVEGKTNSPWSLGQRRRGGCAPVKKQTRSPKAERGG